jgi:lipoate---protein ligase
MQYLDLTLPTPAENLACDEALLDAAERLEIDETLRFWESNSLFVVLGHSNHARSEANLDACRAAQIPVFRRCSGGGAVLQGPGCLNYALILATCKRPNLNTVTQTNRFVMSRLATTLQSLLNQPVTVAGITDLAIDSRKFSGNAQRRRRQFLLFHGTFLIDFTLSTIETFLHVPSRQPAYRQHRPHVEFLTNLPLSRQSIKAALQNAWSAIPTAISPPMGHVRHLVEVKYSRPDWNLKF